MSSGRAEVLARRRERLVLRSTLLRGLMEDELHGVQPVFTWADRIQDGWTWLRTNPMVALAAPVLLSVVRPRKAMGTGMRLWSAWKIFQGYRAARAASAASSTVVRR
ncbi:YqjK family protein [Hydrogenophaga sp.]|uniref:YqjK family protein n=1 Tax=Hydrogenophaga sp. TaxID=1904254 RepID=UPI002719A58F|nr:YqjK family protein [Hydrogenophaga sp.]MDO9434754.1 YqjK family protein [Hydrogenophaga sp.]